MKPLSTIPYAQTASCQTWKAWVRKIR